MAEKRKKLPVYISPLGVASFPWLNKPDTKFNPEGDYRVNLVLDEATAQPLKEKLDTLAKEAYAAAVKANPGKTVREADSPVKPVLDKEKNVVEGKVTIGFKMKAKITSKKTGESWEQRPAIFDAAGKALVGPKVGGGSEIKVAFEVAPYYMPSSKEAGISLRLKAVQIIKLVEFGQKDAASFGFVPEEGYADAEAMPAEGDEAKTPVPADEEADF